MPIFFSGTVFEMAFLICSCRVSNCITGMIPLPYKELLNNEQQISNTKWQKIYLLQRKIPITLGIVLAVSLAGNYLLYDHVNLLHREISSLNQQTDSLQKQSDSLTDQSDIIKNQEQEITRLKAKLEEKQAPVTISSSSKTITAVAVRPIMVSDGFFQDVQYEGTAMNIKVDIKDGTGLVLVNTQTPTGVDFQTSAKTAVKVAERYTNSDLSNKDVIFSISSKNENELQTVDGPSAGMAMTVLLVMEIQDKPINDTILLTGTIQPDGTIGPVGGVPQKAEAAGKYGAKTFIVPKGEATTFVQECTEKKEGAFYFRNCKSAPKDLSPVLEEKYGMKVVEATDLDSVLKYFKS
ncbi:MAG: hypothetical protein EB163_00630 [Nitrososphaeria archaeon]|nr:hypothetical protein [Nitrososphaeria archaeon]NDB91241.1 hypothetical protein [Nitrososphaeria archaeon]NDF26707.1 hypothetical protein [Nitrosopumilaceae archaeon]NDF46903.1 hypothetical protein [Nitrosopumilaceae archaeon]